MSVTTKLLNWVVSFAIITYCTIFGILPFWILIGYLAISPAIILVIFSQMEHKKNEV